VEKGFETHDFGFYFFGFPKYGDFLKLGEG
jgi:hypothetical protein